MKLLRDSRGAPRPGITLAVVAALAGTAGAMLGASADRPSPDPLRGMSWCTAAPGDGQGGPPAWYPCTGIPPSAAP